MMEQDIDEMGQVGLWAQYAYALGLGLTRCSICVLFIRVFSIIIFKRIGKNLYLYQMCKIIN